MNRKKARLLSNRNLEILLVCHPDLVPPSHPTRPKSRSYPIWKTENDVARALKKMGHGIRVVGVQDSVMKIVELNSQKRIDLVFNLLEEMWGSTLFEGVLPHFLEACGIRYTGCSFVSLLACRKKNVANSLMQRQGVLTPKMVHLESEDIRDLLRRKNLDPKLMPAVYGLPYPAIVKLAGEDASRGIGKGSVVKTPRAAVKVAKRLVRAFGGSVVVENFVPGREFHVTVFKTKRGWKGFPPMETIFSKHGRLETVATERIKWNPRARKQAGVSSRRLEARDTKLSRKLIRSASKACEALFVDAYARVDLRMNLKGKVFVIDVNPNPDIGRSFEFADSLKAGGYGYYEMLDLILQQALQRDLYSERNLEKLKRHV